jgi:hypothetical protein
MRLRETLRLTTSSTSFTRLLHRRLPIRAGGGEEALHMVRICVENERWEWIHVQTRVARLAD